MRRSDSMVLVAMLGALLTGCLSPGGAATGAATAEEAVRRYVAAADAKDVDGLAAVWGTAQAPLADRADRPEIERRAFIVFCHLQHDAVELTGPALGEGGRQLYRVALRQGERSATTTFTTIQNARSQRWFVETFDLPAVVALCTH